MVRQGAPRFELGTLRSAVECSTTELYPHIIIQGLVMVRCGLVLSLIAANNYFIQSDL